MKALMQAHLAILFNLSVIVLYRDNELKINTKPLQRHQKQTQESFLFQFPVRFFQLGQFTSVLFLFNQTLLFKNHAFALCFRCFFFLSMRATLPILRPNFQNKDPQRLFRRSISCFDEFTPEEEFSIV